MTRIQVLEQDISNLSTKNESLSVRLEEAQENVIILQDEVAALNEDYNERLIILQDELDKKIALFDEKRDESALRSQRIIKLVSERNQLTSLLKIKDLQLKNNLDKILNFEVQITDLQTNINDLGFDIENKEKMFEQKEFFTTSEKSSHFLSHIRHNLYLNNEKKNKTRIHEMISFKIPFQNLLF